MPGFRNCSSFDRVCEPTSLAEVEVKIRGH